MKRFCLVLLFIPALLRGQPGNRLQEFPLQQVKLLPGIFKEQELTDLNYILQLNADKLLAPFRREAGLPKKSESYGNWENSGLDGHIAGHYLSALAMMYANTNDKRILERLNYTIA